MKINYEIKNSAITAATIIKLIYYIERKKNIYNTLKVYRNSNFTQGI